MVIDRHVPGVLVLSSWNRTNRIDLVGCGGTGSRLAELLCRMIVGFGMQGVTVRLWDGDIVTAANIARQSFEPCEIGQNKAQALALRLSGRFAMEVLAIGRNLDDAAKVVQEGSGLFGGLVITATDNIASRRYVARSYSGWWLDVGNELSTGQAVLGCTHYPRVLARVDRYWGQHMNEAGDCHQVDILPDLPGVNPALMTSRKGGPAGPSCAAMPFSVQGFGVNDYAAMAAASLVKGLVVDGRLEYGAVFFDAAAGRMTPRPITRDWYRLGRQEAKGKRQGGQP